jgi:sterol desaturase/sphingolipid hydroxylase (fatty acid hydroxylase superfamily)
MTLLRYTQDCLEAAQGRGPLAVRYDAQGRKEARPVGLRVFENGALEFISRSPPITPILWAGPVGAYGLYRGLTGPLGAGSALGLFVLGWLVWSLLEYWLHRVIFHLPARTPAEKFRFFMFHGYHHEFPNDPMRLVAPPLLGWPLGLIVGSIYYFALGPTVFYPVLAGTFVGYIAYDWMHYYTHHFRPTTRLGKWMRKYHMEHHYLDHGAHFGVSSPLWDVVFGTFRARRSAPSERAERAVRTEGAERPAPAD